MWIEELRIVNSRKNFRGKGERIVESDRIE